MTGELIRRYGLEVVEDKVESRAMVRETAGAFGLLATALGGLALGLALEPGFLMKLSFVFSGVALGTCALIAIWPRTRRFAARINRIGCPECGQPYRVSTHDILADVGNVRPSKTRSPSGFTCYEVMCTECGIAYRFRRSGRMIGKSSWRRDRATEDAARNVAETALAALDDAKLEEVSAESRLFWDGILHERDEWRSRVSRHRGCLGRPRERQKVPIVRWSNHPDGVAYVQFLEEQAAGAVDSPFTCEDFVSFTWTTTFPGAVASECVILGKREHGWSVIGYRLDGVSDYVQLDGVGRLSLKEPDERGALSVSK